MKARGWLLAAVAALAARPLAAYPDRVDCSRSITSGNMMGQAISPNGAPAQIQLAKGGITIPCGGALMAGDTGLTLVKGSSPDGRRHGAHACQRKHWLAIPDRGGNVSGHGFVGHQLWLLPYSKGRQQVLYYEMVACRRWRAERELRDVFVYS